MAFEDKELDILSEPQEKELEIVAPRKKATRPKKPTKVTPRQEFRRPLPSPISEQIQGSKLRFETSPFRETPEQFILRSTPPEQLDPQQRLRREEFLAARAGRRLNFARPETSQEAEITRRIQRGQEIYDKYGPAVFAIREGLGRAGTFLAEPFVSSSQEFAAIPGDIAALFTGDLKSRQAARDAWMNQFREPLGQGITREGYDPLHLGEVISHAAPLIPFIRGGGTRPTIGTEPFRGGARVGVRPPKRPTPPRPNPRLLGPGEELPFPDTAPTPPPRGRIDMFDEDLGGANLVPYQGGISVSSPLSRTSSSEPPMDIGGLDFDLLPALRPGQSPVMIVPQWMVSAVANIYTGTTEGVTQEFQGIPGAIKRIEHFAPSPVHAEAAKAAIREIHKAAADEGLNSIALVSQDVIKRREIFEEDKERFEQLGVVPPNVTAHETVHVGQYQAAEKFLQDPDIDNLYDGNWAVAHPTIREVLSRRPDWTAQRAAVELSADVIGRQTLRRFRTTGEGIDFLFDSLMHLQDRFGPEVLNVIEQVARISPGLEDAIPLARSMYETWKLERAARSPGMGQLPGVSGGVSPAQIGGLDPRPGQAGAIAPGGEITGAGPARVEPIRGITPEERESNRLRFIEGSKYQEPLFHGTDAKTDFEVFQRQGDIGFHFGTPKAAERRITTHRTPEGKVSRDPLLKPKARIGAYWISAKNPLQVRDVFMSGNLDATIENMIYHGYVENNTNIQAKLDILKKTIRRDPDNAEMIAKLEANLREDVFRQLEAKGYDSFEYSNRAEDVGSISVAVFRPTQIKSVHGNIGTYDPMQESVSLSEAPSEKTELQLREEEAHREFSKINDKDLQRRNELIQEAISIWENSKSRSFESILKELEATDPQLAEIRDQYEIAYFKWMDADRDLSRGVIGPPTITPAGRRFNRAKFLEKSAVKVPLYHGTSSPKEILKIDPSKSDPNALYGPGFYMTQSPEVAAGAEGGYTQKGSVVIADNDLEFYKNSPKYDRALHDYLVTHETDYEIALDDATGGKYKQGFATKYIENLKKSKVGLRTPHSIRNVEKKAAEIIARDLKSPHAYQLCANIERPFDIDAPVTNKDEFIIKAEEWLGEDAYKLRNLFRIQENIRNAPTGHDVYRSFESAGMDRAEINEMLQEMGYDGITHIGGKGKVTNTFNTREEAEAKADEVGGIVRSHGITDPTAINELYSQDKYAPIRDYIKQKVGQEIYSAGVRQNTIRNIAEGYPFTVKEEVSDAPLEVEALAKDFIARVDTEVHDVEGHKVWIAFPNAQVKSDTGNIGTFDPTKQELALSEGPPLQPGDLVKSKSRGLTGKVTKTGEDEDGPWAEVTFNDGTTEELNLNDLTKVTSKVKDVTKATSKITPGEAPEGKIVPSLPGPMRIRGTNLQVDKIGPGDEPGKVRVQFADGTTTQFNLDEVRDRRGRKIKDPILYMIVKDPPIIGAPQGPAKIPPAPPPPPGREGPLYVPVVSNLATKRLTEKFTELLFSNNIEMDATRPISEQVYLNTLAGKVRDDVIDQILGEEGISWEEFAQDALFSVSEGARTMAHYSHIVQRHWKRLIQENPGLIQKAIPPSKQIELMLDEMKRSILGINWWRRLGRDAQKALLTQYSTAAVNYMSATGRIPADAASSIVGAMLQQMMEGKGTWQENIVKAREAAEATLQAHVEVVRALNPMQIEELSRGQLGTEFAEHERIITLLEKYFPDIHSKLFARTYGEEAKALEKIEDYLPAAKLLLPKVKNEAQRRQLDQDIEKYSKKLKREKSNIMWLVRGPEWLLDQVLRPANFGEFLLRRPRFVGRLRLELMDQGLDLDKIIEEETFQDIPEEALQTALSNALEFTMNYEPRSDKDAPYIEKYIGVPFIKMMNSLGIVSLKFAAFPRAMFSAAKTTYEYTPLPILAGWHEKSPFRRVFWKETRKDPKTGEEYNPNPPGRGDYERVGKALIGTFLLALAWKLIDDGILDEDGKKLKTPIKGPDKRPVYEDVERYKPIASHFRIAALLNRMGKGTMGDKNAANEIYEIITGMRRYEGDQDPIEILDATLEFAGGDSDTFHRWNMAKRELGEVFPAPFLTPLLNMRAVIATVDQDENLKKDLKGQGFWGPSIDKIPILRRRLPNLTYPLEPGPARLSLDPAMAGIAGIQLQPGQNAVGEEFKRLGINVRNYLRSDPDPVINREQNKIFETLVRVLGGIKISSPEYQTASNVGKVAMLEEILMGKNGIAVYAHDQALLANPMEAERRKLKGEVPGKYTRKITGVDKVLEIMGRGTRK